MTDRLTPALIVPVIVLTAMGAYSIIRQKLWTLRDYPPADLPSGETDPRSLSGIVRGEYQKQFPQSPPPQ
jgi:hypothetical protein